MRRVAPKNGREEEERHESKHFTRVSRRLCSRNNRGMGAHHMIIASPENQGFSALLGLGVVRALFGGRLVTTQNHQQFFVSSAIASAFPETRVPWYFWDRSTPIYTYRLYIWQVQVESICGRGTARDYGSLRSTYQPKRSSPPWARDCPAPSVPRASFQQPRKPSPPRGPPRGRAPSPPLPRSCLFFCSV